MLAQPLVLFDMDGTLLDTRLDIARAANDARAELGLPEMSVAEVVRAVGDGVNLFVSRVTYPHDDDRFSEARSVFMRHYALNVIGDTRPYDGIFELLESLKELNVPMAVVSNKPENLVDELVRHFKWERFFRCWLGGDSASKPKPAPDPLWLALKRSQLSAQHPLLMVGDGQQDLMAAQAAGCKALWCAWGFNDLLPAGFECEVISHPTQVLSFVRREF